MTHHNSQNTAFALRIGAAICVAILYVLISAAHLA
jgi:hypothetical protein